MKYMRKNSRSQKGFTLIELMIVVGILGVLGAIAITAFRGSSDGANAAAIRGSTQQLSKAVGYIHVNMGNGVKTPTNKIGSMMDILMNGEMAVANTGSGASNLRSQYSRLGMRPLNTDFRVITAPTGTPLAGGEYSVLTFKVVFLECQTDNPGKVCVQFSDVPTATLKELLNKYGLDYSTSTLVDANAAAAATKTAAVTFTAADANALHTVTLREIP